MTAPRRVPLGQWVRDLLMGARFAVTGGRSGWARTTLTGVGVGLGVAVLLLAASVPTALTAGDIRDQKRQILVTDLEDVPKGAHTLLATRADTDFRGEGIEGCTLQLEGDPAKAVLPPGLDEIPAPGEMVVSPALRDLLNSADGKKLLQPRFDGLKDVGTVGDEGLLGPDELLFYAGTDSLEVTDEDVLRVDSFGHHEQFNNPFATPLVALIVVMLVVLLLPIAAFIATAVRFGGERRDQRLAALRLVGADNGMTRRIAAGESLVGAVLGLVLGGGIFLLGRAQMRGISLFNISVFPADIAPGLFLTVLIGVLVPLCAVVVTQLALRKVVISPLGVAREGEDRGRRLWWRLATLALGGCSLFLFGPSFGGGDGDIWLLAGSVVLTLIGVTALLPWAVERAVGWLSGGPLSWQLATRRLQLNSGLAARAVSGITIAVAGAVALQMLYGAVERDDLSRTGQDTTQGDIYLVDAVESGAQADRQIQRVRDVQNVKSALGHVGGSLVYEGAKKGEHGHRPEVSITIADCATLRHLLNLDTCRADDVFYVPEEYREEQREPVAGDRYDLRADTAQARSTDPDWWTVPKGLKQVKAAKNAMGYDVPGGFLMTPATVDVGQLAGDARIEIQVRASSKDHDTVELLRNFESVMKTEYGVHELHETTNSDEFTSIRKGLMVGAVLAMLLIAGSMIVSTLEQLRERRRQLSVLVAFGTKRATLGASVLWQTAIPLVLGLVLATSGGVGLGLLLLRMVDRPVADWLAFVPLVGAGLGMIVLVTVASLPALWRMMRPDGLRTE